MSSHKLTILALAVLMALLLPGLAGPSPAYAHDASSKFEKARECQIRLQNSNHAMKYRHEWERCIQLYEKFVRAYKKDPLTQEASFRIVELYLGLAKISGSLEDSGTAKRLKEEYERTYPASYLKESKIQSGHAVSVSSPPGPSVAPAILTNVRYWSYPSYTRVVFDLSLRVNYHHENQAHSKRLIVDFENARLIGNLEEKSMRVDDGILIRVQPMQITPAGVRAILELDQGKDYRVMELANPHRVVIDIYGTGKGASSQPLPPSPPWKFNRIMIDPGHGGKDPGAIGSSGLTEKEVVLDVALRLKKMIERGLRKEVLMTRESDVFLSLEERTQLANQKQADLFISIHANAAPNRNVRGVEIYTLGQASDASARATAARENRTSDRSTQNLEHIISLILSDLTFMNRLDHSLEFADTTRQAFVKTLGASFDVIDLGVKQAPFHVLLNSGMPSILAEISFLSNPLEEKRLASSRYRQSIAQSLFEGIRDYVLKYEQASNEWQQNSSR